MTKTGSYQDCLKKMSPEELVNAALKAAYDQAWREIKSGDKQLPEPSSLEILSLKEELLSRLKEI